MLADLYNQAATAAMAEGIGPDDTPTGAVAQWVRRNVSYRPETEFFIVLGVAGAIADLQAQAAGFKSAADRAALQAFAKTHGLRIVQRKNPNAVYAAGFYSIEAAQRWLAKYNPAQWDEKTIEAADLEIVPDVPAKRRK
jgi:hypothetical protein